MGDNAAAPASVPLNANFSEVVSAITEGRKGAVAVLDLDGTLAGIVTDGDLRRAFQRDTTNLTAADIMGPNPITVDPDARMSDVVDHAWFNGELVLCVLLLLICTNCILNLFSSNFSPSLNHIARRTVHTAHTHTHRHDMVEARGERVPRPAHTGYCW